MGFVHGNVGLSNPTEPDRAEEVWVLVDTGATLSVFPESLLDRLGIRKIGQRRFRGFGGLVAREVAGVNIHYGGEVASTTAVFGAEEDPAVMGGHRPGDIEIQC